jgi:hypothetical protein
MIIVYNNDEITKLSRGDLFCISDQIQCITYDHNMLWMPRCLKETNSVIMFMRISELSISELTLVEAFAGFELFFIGLLIKNKL